MAATLITAIITQARRHLVEATASYWSDAELTDIIFHGEEDLWGAILDLHAEHFLTVDITNVSLAASTKTLTGVPADTFRIYQIEPRDTTTTATNRRMIFTPRDYNHPDFVNARSLAAVDSTQPQEIFFCMGGAGAPLAAPTIHVAPIIDAAVNLRFAYNPSIAVSTDNLIPGASDQALICWCVAWARAKEREDRSPDPNWIATYATEKQNILTRLTPRQEQEPEVVESLFGGY